MLVLYNYAEHKKVVVFALHHGIGRKKTHCGNERAINDQIGQEVTYHPLIEVFTNLFFVCRYHKMKDQLGVIATLEVKKRFKHSKQHHVFHQCMHYEV